MHALQSMRQLDRKGMHTFAQVASHGKVGGVSEKRNLTQPVATWCEWHWKEMGPPPYETFHTASGTVAEYDRLACCVDNFFRRFGYREN